MAIPSPTTGDLEESQLEDVRSTRALVDLDAIESNIALVRARLNLGTLVIAVVKANGYGHGSTFVARSALRAGATMLAVATVGEGVALRRNGVNAPVLVLGPINSGEYRSAVENSLTLAVGDAEMIAGLDATAAESGRTTHVHLKIDTGMRRYGCLPEHALELARQIEECPHLWMEGVFTHFAEADALDERSALKQADTYDSVLHELEEAGIIVQLRHVANSAAALRSRRFDYDAIRLGIAMYGLPPSGDVPLLPGMRPVMTLTSQIARIIPLSPGDGVSYGATYVASGTETAALVPCGYADGFRRSLSNRGWLAADNRRLPVRGRVCMDQLIIGIPDGAGLSVGSRVTLIGAGNDEAASAVQLARMLDTIPYEIVTDIAQRVPRVYTRQGAVVGVEDLTGCRSFTA